MSSKQFDFAVIGEWHLAFVTAACLNRLGHRVVLVKPCLETGPRWTAFPPLPVTEPELPDFIAQGLAAGTLAFANGVEDDWQAEMAWLAIDTPVNERDESDLDPLVESVRRIHEAGRGGKVLVINSQIPLGFSRSLQKRFGIEVAYIPENMRLGQGAATFLRADRTVIGADREETRLKVQQALAGLETEFALCDLPTAEMIKHATNAFLATSISFANQMALVGEAWGVDNEMVGRALKLDRRIGKGAYVIPGLGFAGGTLPRDLRTIQRLGRQHELPTPLVDAVLQINESTTRTIERGLDRCLGGVEGRSILMVGYSYKAGTDTLRRSMTLELARTFRKQGARVQGFDPVMNDRDLTEAREWLEHRPTWEEVEDRPDAVLLMTPREEFSRLDWQGLAGRKGGDGGTLVFDVCGIADRQAVLAAGLEFKKMWQPVENKA